MTGQEFQNELLAMPLEKMDLDRLERLSAFSLPSQTGAESEEEQEEVEEAKRHIQDEIARRTAKTERLNEVIFRRQERQRADRQHDEHVAQSGRMHVAQMEQSHAKFVFHRRTVWIAAAIAIASALLAWASFWEQRTETRRRLDDIVERLKVLEAERAVGGQK